MKLQAASNQQIQGKRENNRNYICGAPDSFIQQKSPCMKCLGDLPRMFVSDVTA